MEILTTKGSPDAVLLGLPHSGDPEYVEGEIAELGIVSPEFRRQRQISEKIDKSFYDREQSKHLLDIAKRGVEIAIEKSEKDAQAWIDRELKKLNITIKL